MKLPQPYLLFLGDVTEAAYAKTAFGLRDWRPDLCLGEYALPSATIATPGFEDAIELHLKLARRTNPRVRCAGVSLNTSKLSPGAAGVALSELAARPC